MSKNSYATAVSGICTVVFVTLLTVLADLAPALKDWLKAVFTHHWIGKGVLAAGLFGLIYLLALKTARDNSEESAAPLLRLLAWSAICGTIIIFAFFLWEAFGK